MISFLYTITFIVVSRGMVNKVGHRKIIALITDVV